MKHAPSIRSGESGNVLVYILIAIILMAVLNFAFTQSSNEGSSGLERGEAVIAASDIIDYSGRVGRAVNRLITQEGCSETQISFSSASGDDYQHTPSAAPARCQVFNFQGGAVTHEAPKSQWLDNNQNMDPEFGTWFFPADSHVVDIGRDMNEEMMIVLPWIQKSICLQLNQKLDVDNPMGDPPRDIGFSWGNSWSEYTGSFSTGEEIADGASTLPEGTKSGCFSSEAYGGYHFYRVIMAR